MKRYEECTCFYSLFVALSFIQYIILEFIHVFLSVNVVSWAASAVFLSRGQKVKLAKTGFVAAAQMGRLDNSAVYKLKMSQISTLRHKIHHTNNEYMPVCPWGRG